MEVLPALHGEFAFDIGKQLQASTDYLTARPWDPTVWKLRLQLVEKCGNGFEEELDLVGQLFEGDTKNKLMWNYRRCITRKIGTAAVNKEHEFTANILSKDEKNYHAWYHRQWILQDLGGEMEDELDFCHKICTESAFNAFAWEQRLVVVSKYLKTEMDDWKMNETKYAMTAILEKPENEYTWEYLRGLYSNGVIPIDLYDYTMTLILEMESEVQQAKSLNVDVAMMNKQASMHALKLILELTNNGYEPTMSLQDVIDALYSKFGPSDLGYPEKVHRVLEYLDGRTCA